MNIFHTLQSLRPHLKNYVNSWEPKELIFSYELKTTSTPNGLTLSLHQKETNFSVFMDMEEQKHCLRINRFAMAEDARLEELSDALYDAATIELVLQALNLVFFCAEYQAQEEAVFILTEEEASHLNVVKSCFNEISSHTTIVGKRTFLTLLTSSYDYDVFINHAGILKTKMYQELWKRQRTDSLIRQYLQSPRQTLVTGFSSLKEEEVPEIKVNVIAFPKFAYQR